MEALFASFFDSMPINTVDIFVDEHIDDCSAIMKLSPFVLGLTSLLPVFRQVEARCTSTEDRSPCGVCERGTVMHQGEPGDPNCVEKCSYAPRVSFYECGGCEVDVKDQFDIDGDGFVGKGDLDWTLAAMADPYGQISVGDLNADINGDGEVTFGDAFIMLDELILRFGSESMLPLTPTYNEDHVFDITPADIPGNPDTGRYLVKSSTVSSDHTFIRGPNRALQADSCNAVDSFWFSKGSGPRPTIDWDNGYPFNAAAVPTSADRWNYVYYGMGGFLRQADIPDGARAYLHYRDKSGADLQVDYQKAIDEDIGIKIAYDKQIINVLQAINRMHDGAEQTFTFYSNESPLVGKPTTENWQKALGGHRIWSTGTVTYDETACLLSAEITTEMEDFYNFNKGQVDIATGLPDNDNGRMEVLGWAKSFFSRGSVTTTETLNLQCCKAEDCGDPTEWACECNQCEEKLSCPITVGGGGIPVTFTVELFETSGVFDASYEMYDFPEELNIFYEGQNIYSTELVTGGLSFVVAYGSATSTSTSVDVVVTSPFIETFWDVYIGCPA